jgi:tRNA threonylcarbamoyladenosine biosynthesis protein TsaB
LGKDDYMTAGKRILAIETSGRHSSVATLWGEERGTRLIDEAQLSGDQRTAQVLAPTIQKLLAAADWSPKSVELVAVTVGPGSFTGLRIGVTTAKSFAYAVGADVLGINTLATIAQQATLAESPLWTIMDAQRQELFAAKFIANTKRDVDASPEVCIIPQEAWLTGLRPGDRVIGPALKRLASRLPAGIEVLSPELWEPTAKSVGELAWKKYLAGHRDDAWTLSPNYYRPSAAEEKRMK